MRTVLLSAVFNAQVAVRLKRRSRLPQSLFMRNVLLMTLWICVAMPNAIADEPSEGEKLFALKLKPLITEKCLACHGEDPEDIGGSFDLRSRKAMLLGGDSYETDVVKLGHGEESVLYAVVARTEEGYEMPPKESEALTEEQAWWIRDWINEGAPWPDEERIAQIQQQYAEGEVVPTSGGLGESWTNRRYETEDLWAYRKLNVASVPEGKHPVDWFIDQRLEQLGIEPAGSAEPIALLRRLTFNLTGLPPTVEEIDSFQTAFQSDAAAAVEEAVERLIESAHYGEHFARQWLDVARYADSSGFANDYTRPNAWRYRDYVVRAFNTDKPYQAFVRQQIAGDEINDQDPENLIATGFLRMGPWEQTGMSVFQVTRGQWLDDVVDSVGQTFLAHPLQCAKCHDHKFDPIPTRDYYRMMAVFSTTQFAERDTPFLESENQKGFKDATDWVKAKVSSYEKQRAKLNQRVGQTKKKEDKAAKTGDNGLSPGDEASLGRMSKNISRHQWELDKSKPIAFSVYTGKTVKRTNVKSRLEMPAKPWAKGYLQNDVIYNGGDVFSEGDPVSPGGLSAAEALGEFSSRSFPDGLGKRRAALADWMTDERNPLTARVIVNRVWSWHFGQGIAGNPNNFGATGAAPTHPELLDYLAGWFMDHDWSIKRLNRLILSSQAYRRSSMHSDVEDLESKDPNGKSYAVFQPRRLTAEELRDAMLAVSGELNREVGGIPCRPDVNLEVAMQPRQIMGGTASVYEPDTTPQTRNRRSLYTEKVRGLRDPFLETFNQPGFDKSCELRETSTVAPQALTLLNAAEVHDRALALAADLLKENTPDEQVLQKAFRRVLSRPATPAQIKVCLSRWETATEEESKKQPQPQAYPNKTTRTVMAEKTGEPYDFVEFMPAYNDYVPDLQPHQVDARTRGLAHVCLVLLNSNEFAYLD